MNNEYIFERNQQEQELLRLRSIEEALDPATITHLQGTGIRESWRCLEVGAGQVALVVQGNAKVVVRLYVFGIELESLFVAGDGTGQVAQFEQDGTEVVVGRGVLGIEFESFFVTGDSTFSVAPVL